MPTKTFTIGASDNFTHTLIKGVWERFGNDPLTLSDIRIFLPTRRACRAVANAFLQLSDGKAMILPKLIPLGEADSDEETLIVQQLASDKPDDTVLNLRPAMPHMQRTLLLARQINVLYPDTPMAQTVSLAKDLASFIDQSVTAGINFDTLNTLVPEEYSQHWQKTLKFLEIVTHQWGDILNAHHVVDSATRRDSLLRAQAETWKSTPPQTPVIAAGINGSIPAALDLLSVIASLDNGFIVLPALDTDMDSKSWEKIGDTHPQSALKTIINHLGIEYTSVKSWVDTSIHPEKQERTKLISEIMRPAETSDKWQELGEQKNINPTLATKNINRIDCTDEQEEAAVISLILRETLETPDKTAMLVTPDRKLARRVTQMMERWDVTINDSAGSDLALWPVGSFINLSLSFLINPSNAISLLALLKHPLCRCGNFSDQWHQQVALFEKHILRGSRYKEDFLSYRKTLEMRANEASDNGHDFPTTELSKFLDILEERLAPILPLLNRQEHSLKTWITAHIQILENLAETGDKSGEEWLWRHEDGEAASLSLTELLEQQAITPSCDFESYAAMIGQLILSKTVRIKTPAHPRVTILSPMETRLLTADTVIMASLNEGHWPPESPNDPWMSRPMRARYGLPPTDRFIGLAAHDFMNGFCANEVYLTRADRVDNAPTVKSRWLLRLETVLNQLSYDPNELLNHRYQALASKLEYVDDNETISIEPPAPCPPIEHRPKRLSFTDIEKWIKDPYSIYAKHTLRLKKIDDLDGDTENRDKGTLLHSIFERFIADVINGKTATHETLLAIGQDEFDNSFFDKTTKATLWPIFKDLTNWFIKNHEQRIASGINPLAVEKKAELTIRDGIVPFTLYGRADRIDKHADGSLEIIDYKTGTSPSETDIVTGYAPQLPLEALVLKEGETSSSIHSLNHWILKTKNDEDADIKTTPGKKTKESIDEIIDQTKQRLLDMINVYYNTENPAPYLVSPDANNDLTYNDYEHLERTAEWSD